MSSAGRRGAELRRHDTAGLSAPDRVNRKRLRHVTGRHVTRGGGWRCVRGLWGNTAAAFHTVQGDSTRLLRHKLNLKS